MQQQPNSWVGHLVKWVLGALVLQLLVACSPKVGSPEWCAAIKEKSSGDITMNEASDYAKHCVFK